MQNSENYIVGKIFAVLDKSLPTGLKPSEREEMTRRPDIYFAIAMKRYNAFRCKKYDDKLALYIDQIKSFPQCPLSKDAVADITLGFMHEKSYLCRGESS